MKVLVMPDYREGNPYQQLLADAIAASGVEVVFPKGTRRVLPIFRAVRDQHPAIDVLHLHWLEPYINGKHPLHELVYTFKFLLDICLTRLTGTRLVWTVHNQVEHDSFFPQLEHWVRGVLLNLADRVIVHNQAALAYLKDYQFDLKKVDVIPHGHYRAVYGRSIDQTQARQQLNLPLEGAIYLHLGALRPYKGIEQLLKDWQSNREILANAVLVIAGCSYDPTYLEKLQPLVAQTDRVFFYPEFIEEDRIHLFFSAANYVVLPYTQILTSGSVILAMSFDKPVIAPRMGAIPEVLGAADGLLYEPTDEQGLSLALQKSATASWSELRQLTTQACNHLDWDLIGQKTAQSFNQ
jgi:beta-1,4-mannosyltransferase